ncbi:MAG TPA: EpsG family protein [Terracidiphilus sp.]|nr:EpsG family protein [Terracidiphilus sp.]
MTIYLLIFAFLALIAVLMELNLTRSCRLTLLIVGYLILVLFTGLRWETGNDWFNYFNYYRHLAALRDNSQEFEVGYRVANLLFKTLGFSYTGFLLLYSAVWIGLVVASFDDDDFRASGWLLLLFYSSFLVGWMGTARQIMAIGICLFSLRYIVSRNLLRFLICVGLATCFHTTAICFLLAWPLGRIRIGFRAAWFVLGALVAAAVLDVGALLVRLAGNYLSIPYLDQKLADFQRVTGADFDLAGGDLSVFYYVKRLSFLLGFMLCLRLFRKDKDQLYFNMYLMSVVLFILFYSTVAMIPMRAGMYFGIAEIFLLALLTRRIQRRWLRAAYCVLLMGICLSRLWGDIYLTHPKILVPYKAVLINQDVRRDPGWF